MDAQVHFQVSSPAGCETDTSKNPSSATRVPIGSALSDAIAQAGLPLASACGSDGICGRCGVTILVGGSTLAAETDEEVRIKSRNRIDPKLRLACRTLVTADLEITASYW